MAQIILNLEFAEILRAFTTGDKNEGLRLLLQKGLNAMLERESSEQLGAKRYERTEERTDSRNGVRTRELKTRIGRLTLSVPRHRNQPFRTMLFENYSRSEQALLTTMTTMVLEGVSTRKIARKEEVEHAEEEGIIFKTLNNPVEILADENDNVTKIRCIKMELGEPDASGRRRPIEIAGSEFDLDVDCVIMALGTSPNPLIKDTTKGLEINKKGGIVVNEDGLTSKNNVYAGC